MSYPPDVLPAEGARWTYCDLDAAGSDLTTFDVLAAGVMTVVAP